VRPPPLIIRRAIIDPLWIPLSLLFVVVLAVLAVAGLLAAPFDRRLRLTRLALAAATACTGSSASSTGPRLSPNSQVCSRSR